MQPSKVPGRKGRPCPMSDRRRSPVTARSKAATLSIEGEMSMPIHSWDIGSTCSSLPVSAAALSESDVSASGWA